MKNIMHHGPGQWAVWIAATALVSSAVIRADQQKPNAQTTPAQSETAPAESESAPSAPASDKPVEPAPAAAPPPAPPDPKPEKPAAGPTLDETRLTMGKWIETQQIISKERKEWLQGKEILLARLELVKKEQAGLEEKIKQAEAQSAETAKKKADLIAENDKLKAASAQLAQSVSGMESEIRRLFKILPEPIQAKLQPLYQRFPEDPTNTKISAAERFQNVLGILNEVNKANNEITVSYEVRNLSDGKPSEVKVMYLGLAQAYYVSAKGEAGVGNAGPDGWKWEPASREVSADIFNALEIIQGKQTPAFVPLPVKIQ